MRLIDFARRRVVIITVLTSAIVGEVTAGLRTSDGVRANDQSNGVRALPPLSPDR